MKRTGIRRIEDVEGGHIAWLHPGGADLDEVLLELVRCRMAEGYCETWATTDVRAEGPDPEPPSAEWSEQTESAWSDYWRHTRPYIARLDNELALEIPGNREVEVGYYRRLPWCPCGEGHAWHYEPAGGPGPGAMLAVVVSSW